MSKQKHKPQPAAATPKQATAKPKQPLREARAATPMQVPQWALILILAVFSIGLYSNTFENGYVLDDVMVAPENAYVKKGVAGIPEILSTTYMQGYVKMPFDNYRPMSLLTLAIEQQLFDGDPGKSHAINALLFACCVCMLFMFLKELLSKEQSLMVMAACLLFAAHPIHTEVVANIKSRDELLCFLFAITSCYLITKYVREGKALQLACIALCFLLSLLSKETSITLPLIALLVGFMINAEKKKVWLVTGVMAATAVAFLVLRQQILVANHANDSSYIVYIDNQLAGIKDGLVRFCTATMALGLYLKMLVIPAPLSSSYAINTIPDTGINLSVIVTIAIYLSLTVFGVYSFLKRKNLVPAFAVLFIVVNLAIFSNYFFLIGALFAERFLFFSSAGFCLLVAYLASIAGKKREKGPRSLLIITVPLVLVYAGLTWGRNTEWKDNMTLFEADVKKMPENARLNYYYANEMSTAFANSAASVQEQQARIAASIPYYQKALRIYPKYAAAITGLGTAFFKLKVYDSAEARYNQALEEDTVNVLALNGLAGIYFMKSDLVSAKTVLRRCVAINPGNTDVVHNLGLCYLNLGNYDSCIYIDRLVLKVNPQHLETLKDMSKAFYAMKMVDSAQRYVALVQRIDPSFRLQ